MHGANLKLSLCSWAQKPDYAFQPLIPTLSLDPFLEPSREILGSSRWKCFPILIFHSIKYMDHRLSRSINPSYTQNGNSYLWSVLWRGTSLQDGSNDWIKLFREGLPEEGMTDLGPERLGHIRGVGGGGRDRIVEALWWKQVQYVRWRGRPAQVEQTVRRSVVSSEAGQVGSGQKHRVLGEFSSGFENNF